MRAPTFDLTLLRTLVTIADTGSVTAAAKRLAYTQSTVSMQLQRLETQLDVRLHERAGRRLRFTPEGDRLLVHARRLLALNDDAWSDMQARQITGDLTLGIPEDYASLLPSVFAYFHQLYPAVGLTVKCGTSAHLVEQVKAAELDLALVTRQRNSPGGDVIRREPLMWAVGVNQQPSLSDPIPLALYSPALMFFARLLSRRYKGLGVIGALRIPASQWRVLPLL